MLYEMSDEQKKNILVFLERVDLKGKEVFAHIDVLKALQEPVEKGGYK